MRLHLVCAFAAAALVCLAPAAHADAPAKGPDKETAQEMLRALHLLDQSLGLESLPPPHCLTYGFGHEITAAEVHKCVDKALEGQTLPGLGTKYTIAILMASIGPQTAVALSLEAPGWATLSCDPGKPCPPRHAGTDKMGKRVIDVTKRACTKDTTLWLPDGSNKKVCP
jgi:hypothetical protein